MSEREQPFARVSVPDEARGPAARRFAHAAMATVFEVHCVHPDAGYAGQAAQAAFEVLDRLERELSRFLPNSDVSRINALEGGGAARVSPSTMECLQIARQMHSATAGAFDVSIGTGLRTLELLPEELAVRAPVPGVRLDLGGIGKGFAVDRMAEVLAEWEVEQALVHGGFSSVLALEPPPGREGWPLTFSAPEPGEPELLARVSARRCAFSASGTQKGGHILDPRSGRSVHARAAWVALAMPPAGVEAGVEADGDWAATAASSPATLAEALSTAFMILDVPQAGALCARLAVEAWLLREPDGGGGGTRLVHLGGPAGGPLGPPPP